jgi:hypothetical protein
MGHKYIKEDETFSTLQNGLVPKPTAAQVSDNNVLRADGSWVAQSGGGGGGGTGVHTGTTPPTSDIGNNGDLYFQVISTMNYLRMTVYALRGSTNITQWSDIRLKDDNDNYYNFSNDTISASNPGNPGEGVDMLIDNNTNTKYCTGYTPTQSSPLIVTIQFANAINIFDYPIFEYWTANDSSERDPVSFDISVSSDGVDYYDVLNVKSANITSNRKALGYQGNIFNALAYYKAQNAWHKISIA